MSFQTGDHEKIVFVMVMKTESSENLWSGRSFTKSFAVGVEMCLVPTVRTW